MKVIPISKPVAGFGSVACASYINKIFVLAEDGRKEEENKVSPKPSVPESRKWT
jgi:hypothetical protein